MHILDMNYNTNCNLKKKHTFFELKIALILSVVAKFFHVPNDSSKIVRLMIILHWHYNEKTFHSSIKIDKKRDGKQTESKFTFRLVEDHYDYRKYLYFVRFRSHCLDLRNYSY